jgi:hypothetical protein
MMGVASHQLRERTISVFSNDLFQLLPEEEELLLLLRKVSKHHITQHSIPFIDKAIAILANEQILNDCYPTTDPIVWNTFSQLKQCPQTPGALLNRLDLITLIPKISFRILAVCSVVVSLRILAAVHWVVPLLHVFCAAMSRLLHLV